MPLRWAAQRLAEESDSAASWSWRAFRVPGVVGGGFSWRLVVSDLLALGLIVERVAASRGLWLLLHGLACRECSKVLSLLHVRARMLGQLPRVQLSQGTPLGSLRRAE